MTATASIVGIVVALGALILAIAGFRSHRLGFSQGVRLALIWLVIIGGLVAIFRWLGA